MSKQTSRIQVPEELGRWGGLAREYGESSRSITPRGGQQFEEEFLARGKATPLFGAVPLVQEPELNIQRPKEWEREYLNQGDEPEWAGEYLRSQGPRIPYQASGVDNPRSSTSGTVMNPMTGRPIKVGGPTHQQLIREGAMRGDFDIAEFEKFQRENPEKAFLSVAEFDKFQKENPEETFLAARIIWQDRRNEEVRNIREDPTFQEFVERLTREHSEDELLNNFKNSRNWDVFVNLVKYKIPDLNSLEQYLYLLAYENLGDKDEFIELSKMKNPSLLFYFLKGMEKKHGRLDQVLEFDTEELETKMVNFLSVEPRNNQGRGFKIGDLKDLAIKYKIPIKENGTSKQRDRLIEDLIQNQQAKQEILEMMDNENAANNPIRKMRLFLEDDRNYSLEELKKLAKGYGAVGRTRKELIENILEKTQAQKDLREMIERPESHWIVEKTFWNKGAKTIEGEEIPKSERLRNGFYQNWYSDGTLKDSGKVVNDKKEGQFVYRKPDGGIILTEEYKNGLLNGYFEDYYEDERLKSDGHYKDGRKIGFWRYYDEENEITKYYENGIEWNVDEINFYPKGSVRYASLSNSQNSKYITWYENGQKESESNMFEEKQHGPQIEWYENGQIRSQVNYKNGQRNGIETNFYDNGQMEGEGKYENDKKVGFWRYYEEGDNDTIKYYENSIEWNVEDLQYFSEEKIRSATMHYKNITKLIFFYPNGQKEEEEELIGNIKHGSHNTWWPNGNIKTANVYTNGEVDGDANTYYENGQNETEGEYDNGEPIGIWRTYDERGRMVDEIDYSNSSELTVKESVRKFLEQGNYSSTELKHLAKGYDIKSKDTKELIEKLLSDARAIKDLAEMIGRPKSQYIVSKTFYPSGNVKQERLRDGTTTIWDDNGLIEQKGQFIDGEREGKFFFARTSGDEDDIFLDIQFGSFSNAEGIFKNDEQVGIWTYEDSQGNKTQLYFEKGKPWIIEEIKYFEDSPNYMKLRDSRYSKILTLYSNGEKESETNFIEDVEEGLYTTWYDNGQIRSQTLYRNGERDGPETNYYDNGQISSAGDWENGREVGFWTYFDEQGNQTEEINFDKQEEIINGKKEGKFFVRNDDWDIIGIENYKNDVLDGSYNLFFDNGDPMTEGFYKNGEPSGVWRYYDKIGNVIDEHNFDTPQELTVKESRDFWKQYNLVLREPKLIPKLLENVPEKDSTIYAPTDFDILKLEEDLIKGKSNKYLPTKNPKSFLPVIERLKEIYYRPLPEKSLL